MKDFFTLHNSLLVSNIFLFVEGFKVIIENATIYVNI